RKSVLLIWIVVFGVRWPGTAFLHHDQVQDRDDKAVPGHRTPKTSLQTSSGNPIIPGWYADPEAHIFENEYWIYPTYSARYNDQVFFDAFSSKDLITWKKHSRVFSSTAAPWIKKALWAPSIVKKGSWYYLFFGA